MDHDDNTSIMFQKINSSNKASHILAWTHLSLEFVTDKNVFSLQVAVYNWWSQWV